MPVAPSGIGALIRRTPRARSRRSSSVRRELPIPRLRQRAASATRITQARSACAWATAMPTSSSPTTATTAGWRARAAAITSETGKTGSGSSLRRLWSQISIA
ncbi:hypothetical protein GCM10010430_52050 [Kitasatospora cystarginea]|uniref:Uncharacterized protein n=1 Tax=Kitasatospora cystarginea TaxID=58350 RepID=A0ABN3EKP5_9ACTN